MKYEEALSALKNGDYERAARMFEPTAREADYRSDVINHLYTLALHHAEENQKLADVAFLVGNRILRDDPASALDYFQRALVAGLNAEETRRIGVVFESWASEIETIERRPGLTGPIHRVANVVGGLAPGHGPSRYLQTLTSCLKSQLVESIVFTTEWASSWFFNPSGLPQSEPLEIDAEARIASVEGDFCERADRIAESIRESGCQVAFFHANLADQITARVAVRRPSPVQVSVNHDGEMDADLFDASIHLFRNSLYRTRFPDRLNRWIPPASDIESRLATVGSRMSDMGGQLRYPQHLASCRRAPGRTAWIRYGRFSNAFRSTSTCLPAFRTYARREAIFTGLASSVRSVFWATSLTLPIYCRKSTFTSPRIQLSGVNRFWRQWRLESPLLCLGTHRAPKTTPVRSLLSWKK
jgi:hypothetical protein